MINGQVYIFGLFGETKDHFFSQPQIVEIEEPVKKMALGDLLCVFLTESGDVLTYGSDQLGQLGRKQTVKKKIGKGKNNKCLWIVRLMI